MNIVSVKIAFGCCTAWFSMAVTAPIVNVELIFKIALEQLQEHVLGRMLEGSNCTQIKCSFWFFFYMFVGFDRRAGKS